MNFLSVLLNVGDLDTSIEFYREVFGFELLSKKDQLAAVYAPGNDQHPQVIVFRLLSTASARRVAGGGHVGIRALVLEVAGTNEVDRIEAELDKRGSLVTRHGDNATWTAVFGHDPDGIAVLAGTTLTDHPVPLDTWAELHDVLYSIGE